MAARSACGVLCVADPVAVACLVAATSHDAGVAAWAPEHHFDTRRRARRVVEHHCGDHRRTAGFLENHFENRCHATGIAENRPENRPENRYSAAGIPENCSYNIKIYL